MMIDDDDDHDHDIAADLRSSGDGSRACPIRSHSRAHIHFRVPIRSVPRDALELRAHTKTNSSKARARARAWHATGSRWPVRVISDSLLNPKRLASR